MPEQTQPGMQCLEVEALLPDALDGALHGPTLAAFEAHQQDCAICRSLVEEARAGMHLLQGLDEAEPPRNLVHNILAQTIGALPSEHAVPKPRGESWLEKLKGRLAPMFAPVVTPRFAMSFGMAFFSITMLLGIAGFHFADIRHWDLSSRGITKAYYATEARVMRYYENMRLVYEIESRVRDLRHAATPDNTQENEQPPQQPQQAPATNQKNPSKSQIRKENGPKYRRDMGAPELAGYRLPGVASADRDKTAWVPRSSLQLARAGQSSELICPILAERRPEWGTQNSSIPQARQQDPQPTPLWSWLGSVNRRTA
jgi:hypothetical protein